MTLQEAIRSGRDFYNTRLERRYVNSSGTFGGFDESSVLADDWEVEEEKRELSWEEIEDAVQRTRHRYDSVYMELLKKKLGFQE